MERMLLKGLIFIAGIWLIWNSSKSVTGVAKNSVMEIRPALEAKKPQQNNSKSAEEKEPTENFHMQILKGQ